MDCPYDGANETHPDPAYILAGWTETSAPLGFPIMLAELHIYGNGAQGRIGMYTPNVPRDITVQTNDVFARSLRKKQYELKDHLGNVRVVISDLKQDDNMGTGSGPGPWTADVLAWNNYYAFGMLQPGRHGSTESYRYGFNGKEMDNEIHDNPTTGTSGMGNQYDYGFRIYDPRIGKFLSVDPLAPEYPWYTPYQFAGNSPVQAVDLDGREPMHYSFLITKALDFWNLSKQQGFSTQGAAIIISKAAKESNWGQSRAATLNNNYFGLMGGSATSAVSNAHGTLNDDCGKTSADAFTCYINALANGINGGKGWPAALELYRQETISADDLNKALRTGPYEPPRIRSKEEDQGGAYFAKGAGFHDDYGVVLTGSQMKTTLKRFGDALSYKIDELRKQRFQIAQEMMSDQGIEYDASGTDITTPRLQLLEQQFNNISQEITEGAISI